MVPEAALDEIERRVRTFHKAAPILTSAHAPDFLLDAESQRHLPLDHLKGRSVVSLCALADPKAFEDQLTGLGATISQRWRYPDHHPYQLPELRSIEELRGGITIITTAKDFTRFPPNWRDTLKGELLVLCVRLEILKGLEIWNRALCSILLSALLAGSAWAASASSASTSPRELVDGAVAWEASYRGLTAFPEQLVYDVSWGLLSVGEATLEAREIVSFAGRPAYHIVSRAVSNSFCDTFYKVRDINESWIDARSFSSLAYAKTLHEGHFFRDEWVVYDPALNRFNARWAGKDGNYSVREGTVPVSVQDILSSLYFIRAQSLVPGRDVILDVNTKDNWPLVVRVIRKEKIRTQAGVFNTVLVEPALRQEGLFIQKGKKLEVWLSDDARRVPVLMRVEVFFGHVTAKLTKMLQ